MARIHAGRETRSPRKLRRIDKDIARTGKRELIGVMRQLYPEARVKDLERAYDMVTAAINGWLLATTRGMIKGVHYKLLLANCFSVNVCYMRGKPGVYPDYPTLWVQTGDPRGGRGPRYWLRQARSREWRALREIRAQSAAKVGD